MSKKKIIHNYTVDENSIKLFCEGICPVVVRKLGGCKYDRLKYLKSFDVCKECLIRNNILR